MKSLILLIACIGTIACAKGELKRPVVTTMVFSAPPAHVAVPQEQNNLVEGFFASIGSSKLSTILNSAFRLARPISSEETGVLLIGSVEHMSTGSPGLYKLLVTKLSGLENQVPQSWNLVSTDIGEGFFAYSVNPDHTPAFNAVEKKWLREQAQSPIPADYVFFLDEEKRRQIYPAMPQIMPSFESKGIPLLESIKSIRMTVSFTDEGLKLDATTESLTPVDRKEVDLKSRENLLRYFVQPGALRFQYHAENSKELQFLGEVLHVLHSKFFPAPEKNAQPNEQDSLGIFMTTLPSSQQGAVSFSESGEMVALLKPEKNDAAKTLEVVQQGLQRESIRLLQLGDSAASKQIVNANGKARRSKKQARSRRLHKRKGRGSAPMAVKRFTLKKLSVSGISYPMEGGRMIFCLAHQGYILLATSQKDLSSLVTSMNRSAGAPAEKSINESMELNSLGFVDLDASVFAAPLFIGAEGMAPLTSDDAHVKLSISHTTIGDRIQMLIAPRAVQAGVFFLKSLLQPPE